MSIAPEELEGNQNAVVPDELMQAFPILGALMGGGGATSNALGGYTGTLVGYNPGALEKAPAGTRGVNTDRPAYTEEDARAPRNWAPEDIEELQLELVESGFITEDQAKRMIPGQFDPLTHAGFTNLLTHANATGKTWEVVVDNFTEAGGVAGGSSAERDPIVIGGNVGGGNVYKIQLSDPASLRSLADRISRAVLGRKPKKAEMDKILSEIQGAELTLQRTVHNAQESADQTKFDAATNAEVQTAAARTGSGPVNDSTGPALADSLASQYGLTKTNDIRDPEHNARVGGAKASDHLPGGLFAADFAGAKEKTDAFAAWARQNQGEGKLFAKVLYGDKEHKDHVHVTFNEQGAGAGGGGVDQFMAAISATESGGDYNVTNSDTGAHGKFQIMPANWKPWAKEAGLPSNAAKTPENQEKVARFKMQQYREQFGSWEAAAVAWFAGPDDAAAYAKGDRSMLGKSDGNMTVGEYVERAKAGMASIPGVTQIPNKYLPSSTVAVTDVDPAARTEELLIEGAPVEAAAHTIASDTYSNFLKIIGAQ